MLTTGIFLVTTIYFVNAVVSEDYNITACQHTSLILQCHPGQIVHIVNAKYGRDMNFKCGFGFNKNCESHLALLRTRALCEGHEICTIPVEVKVLGDDPCPYTSKYLQVQYRCETARRAQKCLPDELKCDDGRCINNAKVCDGHWDCSGGDDESKCNYRTFIGCSNMYLECNENEVIHILKGQYGRSSSTICQFDVGHYCSAANATRIIKETCNMKRICYINGFNDVFGDPCPNTSKYIQTVYACAQAVQLTEKDDSSEEDASIIETNNYAVPEKYSNKNN